MKFDTTAVLSGLHFLESPRWHNGRVWASDIYGRRVYSAAEDGRDLRVEAEFDGQPSGLGWLADDTLLIAMTGHDISSAAGPVERLDAAPLVSPGC